MNPERLELWRKLDSFDLDGDAAFSFSKRLARDNGWTHPFALRVAKEYKKFLFLAATAGHPVTPSDEVDQAWHLHLVYTRSYWDELCGEILGFPLHHGPTRGGAQEGEKFGDWYARTLRSYQQAFGEEPPREVWPESRVRFGQANGFRRVNLHRVWVVRKPFGGAFTPSNATRKRALPKLAPALGLLFLAGCAEAQSVGPNVFNWHGEAFLTFFWTLCAVALAFALWRKEQARLPLDALFPPDPLDAYEVARLRDGKNLAADVALATLWEKGALEVTTSGKLRATGRALAPLHPFEGAVVGRIDGPSSGSQTSIQSVRRELEAQTAPIDEKLRTLGLLCSRETQKHADDWPLGITLGLLGIGIIKIIVGLSRERPVGFLVVSCGLLAGVFLYSLNNPARRSKRGDLLLEHLSRTRGPERPTSFRLSPAPGSSAQNADARRAGDFDSLALGFALAGMAAFPAEMQRAMRPPSSGGDGGSGCSSSGGDGGGGGCGGGGCGGCGGG